MQILEIVSDMPNELWQRLKSQTEAAIRTTNPNDFAYFKFAYQDSVVTASPVLTEYHITVDLKEPGHKVRQKIRKALIDAPEQTPINISFAGRQLENTQALADIGVAYADKIYFNVGDPSGEGPGPSGLAVWSDYFKKVSTAIRRDHNLYEEIVDTVCQRLEEITDLEQLSEQDWGLLLLMRNLPGVYADVASSRFILKPTQRLIKTLGTALEQNNQVTIYHAANVLEWLAYLKPRMFKGVDLHEGDQARKALASGLLQVIDPAKNMPGRVRMEAAWAISWTSVASQDFGREVYEKLVAYEETESPTPIAVTLRSAALRSFLYPTPYFIAATSQRAGWFQASILDRHEFRRIAISGRHDEALKHFRSELESALPRDER